jgi:hypothetical protein
LKVSIYLTSAEAIAHNIFGPAGTRRPRRNCLDFLETQYNPSNA